MAKSKKGRPYGQLAYTAAELKSKFEEYIKDCLANKKEFPSSRGVLEVKSRRVPTIEEFCILTLGIWATTMEEWRKDTWLQKYIDANKLGTCSDDVLQEMKDVHKVSNHIWHTIYALKHAAIVNGEGHVNGLIFDMKVHYNKNDKQIIEHQGGNALEVTVVRKDDKKDNGGDSNSKNTD